MSSHVAGPQLATLARRERRPYPGRLRRGGSPEQVAREADAGLAPRPGLGADGQVTATVLALPVAQSRPPTAPPRPAGRPSSVQWSASAGTPLAGESGSGHAPQPHRLAAQHHAALARPDDGDARRAIRNRDLDGIGGHGVNRPSTATICHQGTTGTQRPPPPRRAAAGRCFAFRRCAGHDRERLPILAPVAATQRTMIVGFRRPLPSPAQRTVQLVPSTIVRRHRLRTGARSPSSRRDQRISSPRRTRTSLMSSRSGSTASTNPDSVPGFRFEAAMSAAAARGE